MQLKKKVKDKCIDMYMVRDLNNLFIDEKSGFPNVLCVTANEKDAEEFINRKLFLENETHFKQWCDLRDLQANDKNWFVYRKKVLNKTNYIYFKYKFPYKSIAAVFRIFYGCAPIGCSFDTLLETANALVQIPEQDLIKAGEKVEETLKSQDLT